MQTACHELYVPGFEVVLQPLHGSRLPPWWRESTGGFVQREDRVGGEELGGFRFTLRASQEDNLPHIDSEPQVIVGSRANDDGADSNQGAPRGGGKGAG